MDKRNYENTLLWMGWWKFLDFIFTKMKEIFKKIKEVWDLISVKKDWKNPYYDSRYVTLDELMGKLKPLLDERNMMVYNYCLAQWGVRTIVMDMESGETIGSDFVVNEIKDPQQLWRVLTYWRRYNLTLIFNTLADPDDDAQSFYDENWKAKKYDKRIFDMKAFENLKKKKDKYTYEEAMKEINDNYSIDTVMEEKVMDLYGKTAADLF